MQLEQLEDRRLLAVVPPGFVESVFKAGLSSPAASMSVDQTTGNVYFADDYNSDGVLRQIASDASRTLTTINSAFADVLVTASATFGPATDIQYFEGSVYTVVSVPTSTGDFSGQLVRIDTVSGQTSNLQSISGLGPQAGVEAVTTNNSIYFTDGIGQANSLFRLDLGSGLTSVIATNLPSDAFSLERNPADGKLYFARAGQGFFRVDELAGGSAFVTQISNMPNGAGNFAFDPLGEHIYARHNGSISQLALATGVVDTFATGLETSGNRDVAFGPSSNGNGMSLYTGDSYSILEYSGFRTTEEPPEPGAIFGSKWEDSDGDGVRDAGEPAIASAVIYIDLDHDGALSTGDTQTVTDSNGNYAFTGLAPGQYVVRELLPSAYRQTSPGGGRDFYYGWDWSQGNLVKIDSAGVVSTLFSTNGIPLHGLAHTNSGDLFGINGHNGSLQKVNTQTGEITTVGYAGMRLAYGLAYDAQQDVIYGLATPAGARDGNVLLVSFNRATGIVTPIGETLTSGVNYTSALAFDTVNRRVLAFDNLDDEIYAFDIETGVGSLLSVASPPMNMYGLAHDDAGNIVFQYGSYLHRLNLQTGQRAPFLQLSQPASLDSLELADFEDFGHRVEVLSGQTVSGLDFGNQSILSTISGTKWNDLDGDGTRDDGEPVMPNAILYLDTNNNGRRDDGERQTTSAADGSYAFADLEPGSYIVREVPIEEYRQTSPSNQPDFYWGYDTSADRIVQIDSATAIVTPIGEPGSIGISVDLHGLAMTRDGQLYGMSGRDNSLYQIDTSTGAATKIRSTGMPLAWGLAYDAVTDTLYGLATPPGLPQGSVQPIILNRQTGGATFIGDQITTGVPSTGAIAFDPVSRRLFAFDNSDRELIAFDLSSGIGTSLATSLPYSAFGMTHDGQGDLVLTSSGNLLKLDLDTLAITPMTGRLGNVYLDALEFVDSEQFAHQIYVGPATHLTGIDFGNQSIRGDIRGEKWEDVNGNGQRDVGEPAMTGVVVYLDANQNGQLDSDELQTTTDVTGSYAFLDILPGKHIVREVLSQGYEQTSPGLQRNFLWGYDSQLRRIVKVDAWSGQVTVIGQGTIGNGPNLHGLVQTNDGPLFGISGIDNAFYRIDTNTGLATRVAYTGVRLAWALTYDPVTDTIYGAAAPRAGQSTSLQLIKIDRSTGAVTYIGSTPTPEITGTTGMAFDPVTRSVLLFDRSLGGRLFSFDTDTGTSTLLRAQTPLYAFGMASDGAGQLMFPINGQLVRLNPNTGELFTMATFSEPVFLEALEEVNFQRSAHTIYLAPASSVEGVNFGNRSVLSSLSGVQFVDQNGDGARQPAEAALPGVTVYLDLDHDGQQSLNEPSTVTDADGAYTFAELMPGRYIVREVVPAGYVQSPIKAAKDYLVAYDAWAREIVSVDPTTGAVTALVQLGSSPVLHGLVRTNSNELFGLNGPTNTFYKIDPSTGAMTAVGSARRRVAWGLAYDAVNDKIYGLAHPGNDLEVIALAEYDRHTGEAIIIGEPITGVRYTSGLAFDPMRGKILAFDNSEVREIYAFDPETGTGELLSVVSPPVGGFGLAADNQGKLLLSNSNRFLQLDPATGTWMPYLQMSRQVTLESMEFVDFASNAHDVFVQPSTDYVGYDFRNQNIAPSNVLLSTSSPAVEGSPLSLHGSFVDPGAFESHTVEIDWGDGFSQTILLQPGMNDFTISHTYADDSAASAPDGLFAVRVNVLDSAGGSATAVRPVAVENVAPVARLSGPAVGVRGQSRKFTLSATDDSPVDQAGTFTYAIDWGDGSTAQTLVGAASMTADHVYTSSGTYSVRLLVTDKDGGTSGSVSGTILVSAAAMQGSSLVVGGTLADDSIIIRPNGTTGVTVSINGANQGTFQPRDQILVFGQAGGDTIRLEKVKTKTTTTYIAVPAILDGADGNDTIDARGSITSNVLVGGAGGDVLFGGSGRELLMGGLGADLVRGGGGDDILVGGTTDFDSNFAALNAIMSEWRRTDLSYQARVDHLMGAAGGLNGSSFLNPSTVDDDASVDQLYGEGNQDWFFYRAAGAWADVLKDKKGNERTVSI